MFGIPLPITLACACAGVFILGRFALEVTSKNSRVDGAGDNSDIAQQNAAATIVDELDRIAELIRRDLVAHDRSFEMFKEYVARLEAVDGDAIDEARARFTEESREVPPCRAHRQAEAAPSRPRCVSQKSSHQPARAPPRGKP